MHSVTLAFLLTEMHWALHFSAAGSCEYWMKFAAVPIWPGFGTKQGLERRKTAISHFMTVYVLFHLAHRGPFPARGRASLLPRKLDFRKCVVFMENGFYRSGLWEAKQVQQVNTLIYTCEAHCDTGEDAGKLKDLFLSLCISPSSTLDTSLFLCLPITCSF